MLTQRRTRFSLHYSWQNIGRGIIIYAVGDSVAALILDEFLISRLIGMMLVGGTFYALEIPNYFRWIDSILPEEQGFFASFQRTTLAMLYFNPVWIARHLFFIHLFSGEWHKIGWGLLTLSVLSFIINIPISLLANYLIQNKLTYEWRFMASAVFSALMSIYYGLSETLFG